MKTAARLCVIVDGTGTSVRLVASALQGLTAVDPTAGYDLASGLGVPNWAVLPPTLPLPG